MSKKILFTLGILISLVFCFNVCFATGEGLQSAANGVRNVVGGVENTVENASMNISNMSKDATGSLENGMNDSTDSMDNRMNDARNNIGLGTTNTDGYTAARTDTRMTTTGDDTLLGMSSTSWIWIIMSIAAILIIGLVWYYSAQITNNDHHRFD